MAGERVGGCRASRRRLALLASLALAACAEPTVPADARSAASLAYDPRLLVTGAGGGTDTLAYHWPLGRRVSIYVAPGATSGGYPLDEAVDVAGRAWRQVLYFDELGFRRASSPADADIVVQDIDAPPLTTDPGCSALNGYGGVTTFCASESLDSLLVLPLAAGGPGRVKFAITIDGTRASSAEQFQGLVVHELGHAIGLGAHSPDAADVMNGVPTVPVPSPEDARVLRWLSRQPIDLRP